MGKLEYERLHNSLKKLKLTKLSDIVDNKLDEAVKKNLSLTELLDELFLEELNYKTEESYNTQLRFSGFPFVKTLEQFDYNFQPSIDKNIIKELSTLRFINNAENIILLGPPGVGKTHLSIGLGLKALREKNKVLFVKASFLISNLTKAVYENRLKERMKIYLNSKLLIIDEIGYLPLDKNSSNLFFELISKRYEKGSIILTSNRPFSDWGNVFCDNVIASAILDRLLHHSHIISIKGESYRLKEKANSGVFFEKRKEFQPMTTVVT